MPSGFFSQSRFEGGRPPVRPPAMFDQVGLIGCGLMGGSLALAMKHLHLARRVVGYSKSPSTTRRAMELGVIDMAAPSALLAASGADLIILAVPVGAVADTFKTIKHLVGADTLIIDVGSTKSDVVVAGRAHLGGRLANFVPCHPITGSERSGVDAARFDLYRDKHVVLTPMVETAPGFIDKAQALWQALESKTSIMSHELHDAAFAAVSHLPHMLAYAYINGLMQQSDAADLLYLAGPGFRDFSRIAASEPRLWTDVLMANRQGVLAQLRHFQQALQDLERSLQEENAPRLQELISQASAARSQWRPHGSGGSRSK